MTLTLGAMMIHGIIPGPTMTSQFRDRRIHPLAINRGLFPIL